MPTLIFIDVKFFNNDNNDDHSSFTLTLDELKMKTLVYSSYYESKKNLHKPVPKPLTFGQQKKITSCLRQTLIKITIFWINSVYNQYATSSIIVPVLLGSIKWCESTWRHYRSGNLIHETEVNHFLPCSSQNQVLFQSKTGKKTIALKFTLLGSEVTRFFVCAQFSLFCQHSHLRYFTIGRRLTESDKVTEHGNQYSRQKIALSPIQSMLIPYIISQKLLYLLYDRKKAFKKKVVVKRGHKMLYMSLS